MPLSTEVFVMIIFIVGLPFYHAMLHRADLPGHRFFMTAFMFLTVSNIFTVIEEFWFNYFFNICEHSFIALGSIMLLIAALKLTKKTMY